MNKHCGSCQKDVMTIVVKSCDGGITQTEYKCPDCGVVIQKDASIDVPTILAELILKPPE